jgi:hypothetical protein
MGLLFKRQALTGAGTGGSTANFGKVADTEYDGYAVTTSDSADLPNGPCDAIYCTAGGNVAVQNVIGSVTALATTTLVSVVTAGILPIQVSRVLATNTTATGIFALYRK